MPSTLAQGWDYIRERVAKHRGYGAQDGWTDEQIEDIKLCINAGYPRFLFPAVNPPHEWSFLNPTAEVTLPSGQSVVNLPDDFGHMVGSEVFLVSSSVAYTPIRLVSLSKIHHMQQQNPSSSGLPHMAAVRQVVNTPGVTQEQRWELVVFPTANADYVFRFQYALIPDALAENAPHPYGGAVHLETIVEACLMASEQSLDDVQGIHGQLFQERLKASIDYDRRMAPAVIQRNGDELYRPFFLVTYNGNYSPAT